MTKAVEVISKISTTPQFVSEITRREVEYYFMYKGQAFSISKRTINGREQYKFFVYPKWKYMLSELVTAFDEAPVGDIPMITYASEETGGEERYAWLYRMLEEKYNGVDELFNELLK